MYHIEEFWCSINHSIIVYSLSLQTMASFSKRNASSIKAAVFPDGLGDRIQTLPMTVLVTQHIRHNDELCRCLSPISIE
jgi:hypothetical protein